MMTIGRSDDLYLYLELLLIRLSPLSSAGAPERGSPISCAPDLNGLQTQDARAMRAYLVQRLPLVIPTVRGVTLVAMAGVAIPEFCLGVWRFPSPGWQGTCVGTGGARRSIHTCRCRTSGVQSYPGGPYEDASACVF
jgi:hypothetical protein